MVVIFRCVVKYGIDVSHYYKICRLTNKFIPDELRFIRQFAIGKAIDCFENASLRLVETARSDIVILCLNLHSKAISLAAPRYGMFEQAASNTKPAMGRGNTNIPEGGQVASPFQHLNPFGIIGNNAAADAFTFRKNRDQSARSMP